MRKYYYLFVLILIILPFIYWEVKTNLGKPTFYKEYTKNFITDDFKKTLKKFFFKEYLSKNEIKLLNNKIKLLNNELIHNNHNKNKKIKQLLERSRSVEFHKSKETYFNFDNMDFNFTTFKTEDLIVGKNPDQKPKSSSYLDYWGQKLFVLSGDGILSFITLNNLPKSDLLRFTIIPNNLEDFTNEDLYFGVNSYIGVKGFKIIDDLIYVSYSDKHKDKEDCYSTSILRGKLNLDKIIFEKFFKSNTCITGNNDFGVNGKWNQGGRIIDNDDNNIFFSVGTFGYETMSQKKDNIFGKILSINKIDASYRIISMGHRNPQGLVKDKNLIIETEHGPRGGDELNVINLNTQDDKIANYGWPISSYGEHVVQEKYKSKKELLKIAPLYKSHKEHNFIEPIKYWKKSIGVSQLITINDIYPDANLVCIGALGIKDVTGSRSIHFLKMDKDYSTILKEKVIPINERIRDIIYIRELKIIVLYLESSAELAFLSLT